VRPYQIDAQAASTGGLWTLQDLFVPLATSRTMVHPVVRPSLSRPSHILGATPRRYPNIGFGIQRDRTSSTLEFD
jgi:hypothetical protein